MKSKAAILSLLIALAPLAAWADKGEENRWERSIERFEEEDAENPPAKGQVLFLGSSSILFWDIEKSFPELDAINRGFGGSEISDSLHFFDRIVTPYEPRQIVFYAGDNDIDRNESVDSVVSDFETFVNRVHETLPDTEILFIAIKPSISRWKIWPEMKEANERIAAMAEEDEKLTYIDIATPMLGEDGKPKEELFIKDGLHLNEDGYVLWQSILGPYLTTEVHSTQTGIKNE